MALEMNFNTLLMATGLSLGIAVIFLAVNLGRVKKPSVLREAIATLLFFAVILQFLALFIPLSELSSAFWFVIAALPLLLPAPILMSARVSAEPIGIAEDSEAETKAIPSRSAQAEFNEQLGQIPRILAANPQGLTLVEIGEKMNVEWRRLTGAVRELLERGRIVKEEKKYFLNRTGS
ncbi:hypothetical protein HY229_06500 [Candidatus Acetothermia bacterium]|nr:hypothetical protein [Candidatus Acetothermia bacterium]MBI3643732.1 hypothetical protein [Candidatus Acetothermia bacterium]